MDCMKVLELFSFTYLLIDHLLEVCLLSCAAGYKEILPMPSALGEIFPIWLQNMQI